MSKTLKRYGSKAVRLVMAAILAIGICIPAMTFSPVVEEAHAAIPVNYGNPFENGDFVASENWGGSPSEPGYILRGVVFRMDGATVVGDTNHIGPFDYPTDLIRKGNYQLQAWGSTGYGGWGISDFRLKNLRITDNSRNIQFSEITTDIAHCVQTNFDTTVDIPRNARMKLYENLSGWSADGSVYHGVFYLMSENTIDLQLNDVYGEDQSVVLKQLFYADWVVKGWAQWGKKSSNPAMTDGNNCYSLEGAEFAVYKSLTDAEADINRLETYSGDATGLVTAWDEEKQAYVTGFFEGTPGTYYWKEIKAPKGYALDEEVHQFVVEAGKTTTIEVVDKPLNDPRWGMVDKEDGRNGGKYQGQGNAGLAGAEFTFKYYDVDPDTINSVSDLPATPKRSWVIATNEYGEADYTNPNANIVSGDERYWDEEGIFPVMPIGVLTVTETKAPVGYVLNNATTYMVKIVADENAPRGASAVVMNPSESGGIYELNPGDEETQMNEYPISGGVSVQKIDAENGTNKSQGNTSFEGIEYTIYVLEAQLPVVVKDNDGNEKEVKQGEEAFKIYTDKDGFATTRADALPYAKYRIKETAVGPGYHLNKDWYYDFFVDENGKIYDAGKCANQVIRGDFNFIKLLEGQGEEMANIPFLVTSNTTGEWHIIVTDPNGEGGTTLMPHSQNTNANDAAYNPETGEVDLDKLTYEAGVWFNGRTDVAAPVNNEKGALPYDTYNIKELSVPANDGLLLIDSNLTIYRDGTIATRTWDDVFGIKTTLTADGEHEVVISENTHFVDKVDYYNFKKGETYTLAASIHVFDEEGNDEGVLATASTTFKASDANGTVEVDFGEINTIGLEGKKTVCYEVAYKGEVPVDEDGNVPDGTTPIVSHEDPNDEGQTVYPVPDKPEIEKYINKDVHQDVMIEDTFTYDVMAYVTNDADTTTITDELVEHLQFACEAEEVVVADMGSANNHATNGAYSAARSDATVTAEGTDLGEAAEVTIDGQTLTVNIADASAYRGHWLRVTFKAQIAIDDPDAYIEITDNGPVISNEAHLGIPNKASYTIGVGDNPDKYGKHESNTVTVKPEVPEIEKYINKDVHQDLPDMDETFTYDIMAKITGNAIATTITDELVKNLKFVSSPEEISVVALEDNNHLTNGVFTAENADATVSSEDGVEVEGASVAINGQTLTVRIPDATPYRNMWVRVTFDAGIADNADYTLIKADAVEERAVPNVGNAPVVSELDHEGIPNKASYTIDTDQKASAYSDVSNTVTVTAPQPKIGTSLADDAGNKEITPSKETILVDTVSYEGLTPGKEYSMYLELMNKKTGNVLIINGEKVTGYKEFVPEKSSGTVEVDVVVNTSDLADYELVAFESCFKGKLADKKPSDGDKPIAEHKDIEDKAQTVKITKKATPETPSSPSTPASGKFYDKTGNVLADYWPAFLLLAIVVCGGAGYGIYASRKAKKELDLDALVEEEVKE